MNAYVGWISNVAGRLLFNLHKPLNYRLDRIVGDIYSHRFSGSGKWQYAITMLIDLRDENKEDSSKFTRVFFITEESCEHDSLADCQALNGNFYLLVDKKNAPIKNDRLLLEKFSVLSTHEELEKFQEESLRNLDETHFVYPMEVSIKCNGLVTIKSDSENHAVVTMQAFIFIKYLFHKHVFHDLSQENISRIVLLNDGEAKAHEKIFFSMKKQISEIRNAESNNAAKLHDLKGVLTYVKTFLELSNIAVELKNKETLYLKNIEDALSNALLKRPYKPSNINTFIEDLQRFASILLAVLAPYMIIKSKVIDKCTMISTDWFFSHYYYPYYFIAFIGLFLITLLINQSSNGSTNTYTRIFTIWVINGVQKNIKYHNKPTIGGLSSKYLLQYFVSIEMYIRRTTKKQKTILMSIGLLILGIFMAIGLLHYNNLLSINKFLAFISDFIH